jgi:PAS domain S-box-containing protein
VVIDQSLRIVSVNRNFLEKTRRETRTTLGRKIEGVFPQVLLEYTRLDQKVRQVFHTGRSVEGGKLSYRAPGVPTRLYYYRLIPLKTEEEVENVMLLMDDITKQEQLGEEVRRAERHLASVVECANDLVVSMDPRGRIVTWNQAAERVSGLRADQVQGGPLVSFCADEEQPVMEEMLQRLARGEGVQNTEVNLLIADSQGNVPIAWSCSPMRDDTGKVVGIVAVGRDLTEQRRLEAQLIHSAKMASLGVMAGGIAHELRNPLGIISTCAQLLLEYPDNASLHSECAQKAYSAAQRASLIIENLLKFARPQSERMKGFDLHAVLEETFILLAHQMTLRKVMLGTELQPDLPRVYGNPELLQQVFANLVLNACNAMPDGGMLTVATRTIPEGAVEIRFRDTGCGIPPERLPHIFDPFFTTMPVGQGTGLGLSISYSILQQHRGTIEVASQVGQGTTFTVRLPATSG